MNKLFVEKCKEIFIKQNNKEILDENIKSLQIIMGREVTEEHKYILTHYSGVFLREKYELCSKYRSPIADENGAEPFLYFLGLDGNDNIFSIHQVYKNQLPDFYYPIALADGGNIICINDSSDCIYMWIHDDIKNAVHKIFDSFQEMIMMIKKFDYQEDGSGVIDEEIVLSEEFFAALKAMKK